MSFQTAIDRLKRVQSNYALQALKKVGDDDKSEFAYGQRSGVVIGLEFAIEELQKLQSEEDAHDTTL